MYMPEKLNISNKERLVGLLMNTVKNICISMCICVCVYIYIYT